MTFVFFQCMKSASIHNVLCQMSYGFRTQVSSFGCYDVNGYRLRSEKYESVKPGLTTINSGVCVTSYDENGNAVEFYGVIEDIIKIEWEGSMELELVLFYCRWFDPTPNGLRRTEDLGLVEIKHSLRLSNFDPYAMASQVTQVYYLSYPCKNRDISAWWVMVRPVLVMPPEGPALLLLLKSSSLKREEGSQGPKQNWRCHCQVPRWLLYQVVTSEYISN